MDNNSFELLGLSVIFTFLVLWLFRVRLLFPSQYAEQLKRGLAVADSLTTLVNVAADSHNKIREEAIKACAKVDAAILLLNSKLDAEVIMSTQQELTIPMLNTLRVEVAAKIRLSESANAPGAVCGIGLDPVLCGKLIDLAEEALANRQTKETENDNKN